MTCPRVKIKYRIKNVPLAHMNQYNFRYLAYLQDEMEKRKGALDEPAQDPIKAAEHALLHRCFLEYARILLFTAENRAVGGKYVGMSFREENEKLIDLIDKVKAYRECKEFVWSV
jgi:hypothetical protein